MKRLALLLLSTSVLAQDLTHKAAPQKGTIVIRGATVHPVSGPAIENGVVVFDKGRITLVGKLQDMRGGAEVIDATGKHVYPGFISAYSQLGLREISMVRAMNDYNEVGAIKPEVRAAVAVNPDSALLPVTRSNGILTFATFPAGGLICGRASVMRMDGWTWEDMSIRPDAGLVVRWPTERPQSRRRRRQRENQEPVNTRADRIREAFARARAYHAARKSAPDTPIDIRWEAMRAVLEGRRPVFLFANEYDQIVSAVEFAVKQKVSAIIVGGRDAHLCTGLLKRHNVAVIVDSIHRFPKRNDSDYDEVYRLPAKLEAAGLKWCLASGEREPNRRNLPYAAARAAAYGLDRDAALRAITLGAARVLGIDDELGSLEKGKSATLIITDGDPLEVTTNVEQAFIDGRKIDLSNKQTKLAEKYRTKYRQLQDGR